MPKQIKTKEEIEKWSDFHNVALTPKRKAEYDVVKEVREAYEKARDGRRKNSYWGLYGDSSNDSKLASWDAVWDLHDKAYFKIAKRSGIDAYKSNIKTSHTQARVHAFINQFKKVNIGWTAFPNNQSDLAASKVADKLLNHWYYATNAQVELVKSATEAAKHGTGFFRVCYKNDKKEKTFRKDPEKYSEDELKEFEEKKTLPKEKRTIEASRIQVEYVPTRELYVDPQARCIHGVDHPAAYVIRRRFVNIDSLKSMFKGMPGIKNLDMVKPMGKYKDEDMGIIETPSSATEYNSVELIEYESELYDSYRIVANDIVIYDEEMPYDHKEITYQRIPFIEVPSQFYGIGIADMTIQTQGAYEIMINMISDFTYLSHNHKWAVSGRNSGEIEQQMLRADSAIVTFDTSDGKPISSKIMPLSPQPIGFDPYQMLDRLDREVTQSTMIDPSQLSVQQAAKTATSAVMNKEQLETMISAVITNFVNDGYLYGGRQVWRLMQQYYTIPQVKSIVGDDGKETLQKQYKQIRLPNTSIEISEETVEFKEDKNTEYSFFELDPKYMNTEEELDIIVKPDSLEVLSKSIEMAKAQENFQMLIPFAVDVKNPAAIQQNPLGMVNADKLFQYFFEKRDIPMDLLVNPEVKDEHEKKRAESDFYNIMNEVPVPRMVGQSKVYTDTLYELMQTQLTPVIEQLQNQIDNELMQQQQEMSAMIASGQLMPDQIPIEPNPDITRKLDIYRKIEDKLKQHIFESLKPDFAKMDAVAPTQPQQPPMPPQPPMGGMGGMEGGMDPMMGGDMGIPEQVAMPGMM